MAIIVDRKKLSLLERTYIPQILSGLCYTMKNMLAKKVTLSYPDERPTLPKAYRGAPTLIMDANGRQKCVSCQMCEFVCPSKAIKITPSEIDPSSENAHIQKEPKDFQIDMLRCIYCGLCQEVCPENAIVLQNEYSINFSDRKQAVRHKDELYALGKRQVDNVMKWDKIKEAREKGDKH